MKNFIQKNASGKSILFLSGMLLLFNFVLFPVFLPNEQNTEPIDIQFAYTPQKAYHLIENYEETVIKLYIFGELTIDFVYPVIYSLLLSFILFLVYKKQKIALFPFLILIADYFENFGIVTMLCSYPQKLINVAWVTSFFSTLKWILIIVSILIITFGLIKKLVLKCDFKIKCINN
ncbi:MAG: hypothetical protein K8R53_03240 [Bacteroidales bacterium]|nr:hypothetical protein [Bacteroidales bacterium]